MADNQKQKSRPSLRRAIDGFCKQCIYDPYARGTWRQQVEICTSHQCPLFDVRPRFKRRVSKHVLDDHPRIVGEMYEQAQVAESSAEGIE